MAAPKGNQNAVKPRRWREALERALSRAGKGDVERGLNPIADRLVALARSGDVTALKELGDRLDGKPAQAITGPDGGALQIETIRREIVEPPK